MDVTESRSRSSHDEDDDDVVWETKRQENIESMNRLPKADYWNNTDLFLYQGYWFAQHFLPGVMSFQQHFQARDDDIIIASYPKSGTTWLKSLVYSIVNRKFTSLLKSNPHELVPFLEVQVYEDGIPRKDLLKDSKDGLPRLFATHIPYSTLPESVKSSKCKIVYICRNPLDVVVSFWNFIKKLSLWKRTWTMEEFVTRFGNGVFNYGPFTNHLLGYWKESLERREKVLFLKYEDMKADTVVQVKKLAEFLEFPFSKEEENRGVADEIVRLCSFESLQGLEANQPGNYSISFIENNTYFRKGEVGDWVNHLSPSMIEQLNGEIGEKLCALGLTFHS